MFEKEFKMKYSPDYNSQFRIRKGGKISLVVSALVGSVTILSASPSGGVVTSGSANISQSGATTNITQSTNKATINWQNFSIAKNETVNFAQPNVNAITLNRVVGNERSVIDGALNANGQVWILNSNGVLFNSTASINTAGLLATTKNISDADFNAGNYKFTGESSASVINMGTIEASDNGYVAMLANTVQNDGTIKAYKGSVHLTGASEATINLNGNSIVTLTVEKGVLDALVENKGAVLADGGEIYLTTNAVDELLKGVVNNSGIIEANSIDDVKSHVELFAHGGTAKIGGTIIAKDGFVETSGKYFDFLGANIKAGEWLIDPVNVTIDSTLATAIQTALGTGNVTITTNGACTGVTCAGTGSDGNINVNSAITWATAQKLTLNADNNIYINADITASNAAGKLALYYGDSGDYHINAKVNLTAGENFFTKKTSDVTETTWTVVTDSATMQGMTLNDTSKHYVLGIDLSLSGTNNWTPIGYGSYYFKGKFDGLGHTVSNVHINKPVQNYVGLFGQTDSATIQNIGVMNVNITGQERVGGLVGFAYHSNITNSYTTGGSVNGTTYIGGLVGFTNGTIANSYATESVTATGDYAGGLVGRAEGGSITNAYATGAVTGSDYVGGLVGMNMGGSAITKAYATGAVSGTAHFGGLAGHNANSTISSSFWDTQTTGQITSAGGVGKTTKEMSYGQMYKDASWDIVVDNSVTSNTPILKKVGDTYKWAISPLSLSYTLSDKTTTYNGNTQNLSDFYTNVFGADYSFINAYKFQKDSADVTGYKNAGTYSSIKVASNSDFLTIASGTDGKLTINKKDLTAITAENKTYNGNTDATLVTSSAGFTGIITGDTLTVASATGAFDTKDVGEGKTVNISGLALGGADASNYNLIGTTATTTANITAMPTPTPITPPVSQKKNNINDILTPIINGVQTTVQVPNILVNLSVANAPSVTSSLAMQQTNANLATNLGLQTGSVQITSTAAKGEEANSLITLSEIKEAMRDSTQDVRVPFANNSIIDLVNGGVNLPEDVDQLFYVTKTAKKKVNKE